MNVVPGRKEAESLNVFIHLAKDDFVPNVGIANTLHCGPGTVLAVLPSALRGSETLSNIAFDTSAVVGVRPCSALVVDPKVVSTGPELCCISWVVYVAQAGALER